MNFLKKLKAALKKGVIAVCVAPISLVISAPRWFIITFVDRDARAILNDEEGEKKFTEEFEKKEKGANAWLQKENGANAWLQQAYGFNLRFYRELTVYYAFNACIIVALCYKNSHLPVLDLIQYIGIDILGTFGVIGFSAIQEHFRDPNTPVYHSLLDQTVYFCKRLLNIDAKTCYGATARDMAANRHKLALNRQNDVVAKQNELVAKQAVIEEYQRVLSKQSLRQLKNKILQVRAFEHYQNIQNLDILSQSRINLRKLQYNLRILDSRYYSREMIELINAKRKTIQNSQSTIQNNLPTMLTLEERAFAKSLLNGPWCLTHATPNLEQIKSTNRLLSTKQLRKNKSTVKTHTADIEGTTDYVFFSMGPGDFTHTPLFLTNADGMIKVDKDIVDEHFLLSGSFGSDHVFAYRNQQISKPIKIYDGIYQTQCLKVYQGDNGQRVVYIKRCFYTHADGQIFFQDIERGEEICMAPQIELFMVLKTIEKLRLLGVSVWKKAMAETDLQKKQQIVQGFFPPGAFEVHKPVEFWIDKPGVHCAYRDTPYQWLTDDRPVSSVRTKLPLFPYDDNHQYIQDLYRNTISAFLWREQKELHALYLDVNRLMKFEYYNDRTLIINLFIAIIYSGNLQSVKKSLDQNANILLYGEIQLSENSKKSLHFGPLEALMALANSRYDLIRFEEKKSDDGAHDVKIAIEILTLLLEHGQSVAGNQNIRQLLKVGFEDIENAILYFKSDKPFILKLIEVAHVKENDFRLANIIHFADPNDAAEIIEALIKRFATLTLACKTTLNGFSENIDDTTALLGTPNPLTWLTPEHLHPNTSPFLPTNKNMRTLHKMELPPLGHAIEASRLEVVKCLLSHKADMQANYSLDTTRQSLMLEYNIVNSLEHATQKLNEINSKNKINSKKAACQEIVTVLEAYSTPYTGKKDIKTKPKHITDHKVFVVFTGLDKHNNRQFVLINPESICITPEQGHYREYRHYLHFLPFYCEQGDQFSIDRFKTHFLTTCELNLYHPDITISKSHTLTYTDHNTNTGDTNTKKTSEPNTNSISDHAETKSFSEDAQLTKIPTHYKFDLYVCDLGSQSLTVFNYMKNFNDFLIVDEHWHQLEFTAILRGFPWIELSRSLSTNDLLREIISTLNENESRHENKDNKENKNNHETKDNQDKKQDKETNYSKNLQYCNNLFCREISVRDQLFLKATSTHLSQIMPKTDPYLKFEKHLGYINLQNKQTGAMYRLNLLELCLSTLTKDNKDNIKVSLENIEWLCRNPHLWKDSKEIPQFAENLLTYTCEEISTGLNLLKDIQQVFGNDVEITEKWDQFYKTHSDLIQHRYIKPVKQTTGLM